MSNLKQNTNKIDIESILQNTKDAEKTVLVWKIIDNKKITSQVILSTIRKNRNDLILSGPIDQKKILQEIVGGTEKVNVFLPDDSSLFQASIVTTDELTGRFRITIKFPEMIAYMDRRKHIRLFVDQSIRVISKFTKMSSVLVDKMQSFEKSCYDISAGGLSFIISKQEQKFFEQSDYMAGITVEFGDELIVASGKIVNLIPVEPNDNNKLIYKGYRVCIEFSELEKSSRDKIHEFVLKNFDLLNIPSNN